jgi:hypothetical protein
MARKSRSSARESEGTIHNTTLAPCQRLPEDPMDNSYSVSYISSAYQFPKSQFTHHVCLACSHDHIASLQYLCSMSVSTNYCLRQHLTLVAKRTIVFVRRITHITSSRTSLSAVRSSGRQEAKDTASTRSHETMDNGDVWAIENNERERSQIEQRKRPTYAANIEWWEL